MTTKLFLAATLTALFAFAGQAAAPLKAKSAPCCLTVTCCQGGCEGGDCCLFGPCCDDPSCCADGACCQAAKSAKAVKAAKPAKKACCAGAAAPAGR